MPAITLSKFKDNPQYTVTKSDAGFTVFKQGNYYWKAGSPQKYYTEYYQFTPEGKLKSGYTQQLRTTNSGRETPYKRFTYTAGNGGYTERVYELRDNKPRYLETNTLSYASGVSTRTGATKQLTQTQQTYQEKIKANAPKATPIENTAATRYINRLQGDSVTPVSRANLFSQKAKERFNINEGKFSDEITLTGGRGKSTAYSGLGMVSVFEGSSSQKGGAILTTQNLPSTYGKNKQPYNEFIELREYPYTKEFQKQSVSELKATTPKFKAGLMAAELGLAYSLQGEEPSRFKNLESRRLKEQSFLAGGYAFSQNKFTKNIAGDTFDFTVEGAEKQSGFKGFLQSAESKIGLGNLYLTRKLKEKAPAFTTKLDKFVYNLDVYSEKRRKAPTLKESFFSFGETVRKGQPTTIRLKDNLASQLSKADVPAIEFTAGAISGVRNKPIQTAATAAAFFALPAASKGIRKVVSIGSKSFISPYYGAFLETTAKATNTALLAGYATTIGVRADTSAKPARTLGSIASTEVAPMVLGNVAGQKFFSFAETKFLKRQYKPAYYQPYKTTKVSTFEGREPFPLVQSKGKNLAYRQYKDFIGSKKGLPIEYANKRGGIFKAGKNKAEFAWKAVGESWGDKITLQPSGNYELQGTYYGANLSPNFLRLSNSYSFYPSGDVLVPYGSPRAVRQATLGFKPINAKSNTAANKIIESGNLKQGYIYTFSTKAEQEGIMIGGTQSYLIDVPYYTTIPSTKQISGFEKITRGGQPEYIQRVQKFSWKKPTTYLDKIQGKKAGTIKKFGFRGVGKEVLIEVRGTEAQAASAAESTAIPKGTLSKALGYGKSSSAVLTGSSYLFTPQSVATGSLLSYSAPYTRSYSYSKITSSPTSSGYSPRSYPSLSSYQPSSPSYPASSAASSASSASSSISSAVSSSSSATSGSSGSSSSSASSGSSSSSGSSITTGSSLFLPKFRGSTNKKKRKERLVNFNPKYFASVEATTLKIRGRKPSKRQLATGLNIRPLLRGM